MLVSVAPVALIGIWSDSRNMEDTAAMWFFMGLIGGGLGLAFLSDYEREERPQRLSRDARRALRKREDEIRLQAAIEEAEEKAGIYVRR